MIRIVTFAARYPLAVLAALLILTLLALSRLDGLRLQISFEQMTLEGDAASHAHERFQRVFGDREGVLLFLRDAQLMDPDNLRLIERALQKIQALEFVDSTASLFSLANVRLEENDEIRSSPYLGSSDPPRTQEERRQWLDTALRNPLVGGQFLAEDGRAFAVSIRIRDGTGESDAERLAAIEGLISPVAQRLDSAFLVGPIVIREALGAKIHDDQTLILPAALGLLLALLALLLHRLNGALVPLLTGGASVIWTLALMVEFGVPVNIMTSIVPALLIIVGATEDIHLLAEYYSAVGEGLTREEALQRMGQRVGIAVLLTAVTTAVGFLSIALNPIAMLQEFGLVAGGGLVFNFVITILLVPAWLKVFGSRPGPAGDGGGMRQRHLAVTLSRLVIRFRHAVWGVLSACLVLCLFGVSKIQVDNDPMGYFEPGEPVQQRFATVGRHMAGVHGFSIVLDAGVEDTFAKVRYLAEVHKLQAFLDSTGLFRKSYSFADLMALVNVVMEGDDGKPYLPEDDAVASEYVQFLNHDDVAEYVSADYSQVRILVRHDIGSSHRLNQALAVVQEYLDGQLPRGLDATVTGEEILTKRAADHMAMGQVLSLGLVLAVIWVLVGLLFVNARAGLIALLPNLLSIAVLFGFMGWAGIALDTGTAMVAAIALGICVDDTMHFMIRFHQCSQGRTNTLAALEETVRLEAIPIFGTSLALAAGFALLSLSGFPPVARFGWLSTLVILTALGATFLFTPLLLSSIRLVSLWDMLDLKLRQRVRRNCPLFRDMRTWQIKRLILLGELLELEAGDALYRQGDQADAMFVLLEGEVELWEEDDYDFCAVAHRREGDILGGSALTGDTRRTTSAIALNPARLLVLRWEDVQRINRLYPWISACFYRNLAAFLGNRDVAGKTA